jgi:hypothetical protein
VIFEQFKGDAYQKGNESRKAKLHEDLICLYFEMSIGMPYYQEGHEMYSLCME